MYNIIAYSSKVCSVYVVLVAYKPLAFEDAFLFLDGLLFSAATIALALVAAAFAFLLAIVALALMTR